MGHLHHPARIALMALAMPVLLGACASMSESQCRSADWRLIGYADGSRGLPAARIEEHAKSCAKIGVRPELDTYLRARTDGLLEFCQPENAFRQGRIGAADRSADCAPHLLQAFRFEYGQGREIHDRERDINQLRARLQSDAMLRQRQEGRIDEIRRELERGNPDGRRRRELLDDYDRLLGQREQFGRDRFLLERDLQHLEFDLRRRLSEMRR